MSRRRAASATALLALAGLLVVVAVQAWRLPAETRRGDAELLGRERSSQQWSALTGPVPAGLGLRDDVAFRRAVGRFLEARRNVDPIGGGPAAAVVASTEASILLGRVERGGSPRQVRSTAANLDAVVTGEGAELDGDVPALEAAVRLLRTAIRLDRGNEAAKANLERLLDEMPPESTLAQQPTAGELGGAPGAGTAGNGF